MWTMWQGGDEWSWWLGRKFGVWLRGASAEICVFTSSTASHTCSFDFFPFRCPVKWICQPQTTSCICWSEFTVIDCQRISFPWFLSHHHRMTDQSSNIHIMNDIASILTCRVSKSGTVHSDFSLLVILNRVNAEVGADKSLLHTPKIQYD